MEKLFIIKYLCLFVWMDAVLAAEPAWPTRPVRVMVPFAPGGTTDVIARIVAARMTEISGQQWIVDNRAGAGGNIGTGIAANATPDGHTVFV